MKYTSSADAPKAYHLPAGDYTITILEASETVSRSTGADMIKLTLEAEAADLPGRTLRARLKVEDYNGRSNNKIDAWLAPLIRNAPTAPANAAKKEGAANEPF
jgi:hypothetical protein